MSEARIPLFSGEPPTDLLGQAGAIISAILASTFAASVIYDWGFLWALGLGFEDIPSSLQDHTRSALLWVPAMILGMFVFIAVELFTQRMDNGRMAHDQPPARGCFEAVFVHGPRWLVTALGPITFALSGEVAIGLFLGVVAGAWLVFSYWIVTHPVIGSRLSWLMRRAFYYVPAVALSVFAAGYQTGIFRLILTRDVAVIEGRRGNGLPVLRQYESGILVLDESTASFVRWEKVESISVPVRRVIWRGVICELRPCAPLDQPDQSSSRNDDRGVGGALSQH